MIVSSKKLLDSLTSQGQRLLRALPFAACLLATASMAAGSETSSQAEALQVYRIDHLDRATLKTIAEEFEIFDRHGKNSFSVYVTAERTAEFLALAPKAQLKVANDNLLTEQKCRGYMSVDEIYAELNDLAAKHSDIATVGSIGKSKRGKEIRYIKVSDNAATDESDSEPVLVIDSATHGSECVTTETLMHHIREIITKAGTDDEIKGMVHNAEIYFIPVVSPDSHRKSRFVHGLDPNRSYPGPGKAPRGRLPSIDALIDFFDEKTPDGSMTWHAATNNGMIMHPWGHKKGPVSDNKTHVQAYEKIVGAMKAKVPRFDVGSIIDTIYEAHNSSIDYYFMANKPNVAKQYQTYSVAIELRGEQRPHVGAIGGYVRQSRGFTFEFIKAFTSGYQRR